MTFDTTEFDHLGLTLDSINFKNREPGYFAFREAFEISADILWHIFGRIIKVTLRLERLAIQLKCTANVPVGRGCVRLGMYNNFNKECSARKGIVVIKNRDSLCLPCSLYLEKLMLKRIKNTYSYADRLLVHFK